MRRTRWACWTVKYSTCTPCSTKYQCPQYAGLWCKYCLLSPIGCNQCTMFTILGIALYRRKGRMLQCGAKGYHLSVNHQHLYLLFLQIKIVAHVNLERTFANIIQYYNSPQDWWACSWNTGNLQFSHSRYHRTGSLVPDENTMTVFSQIYICDNDVNNLYIHNRYCFRYLL